MESRKQRKMRLAKERRTSSAWSKRNHRSSYMGVFYRHDRLAPGHSGHQQRAIQEELERGSVVFIPRGAL